MRPFRARPLFRRVTALLEINDLGIERRIAGAQRFVEVTLLSHGRPQLQRLAVTALRQPQLRLQQHALEVLRPHPGRGLEQFQRPLQVAFMHLGAAEEVPGLVVLRVQFDRLFEDGDTYMIGNMQAFAIYTPGHTPACMVHVMGDAAFVGDTLFMPDGGSARADFPGGDAATLYDSIQKVLALPDETRLFMCHDYGPNGRDIQWETTVGEEKAHNIHVGGGKSKDEFVSMRDARDATLAMPKLIIPSLQVNMRAGNMPAPDEQGDVFLKVPVNKLGK